MRYGLMISAGLALMAAIATFSFGEPGVGQAPPGAQPAAAQPAQRGLAFFDSVASQGKATQLAAAPETAAWRSMDAAFRSATSMRAFFYQAIRRPSEGGYFYAMQALSSCSKVEEALAAASSPPRQQAAVLLRTRCDFTAEDQEDAFRQFSAIRNLTFADDPILDIMMRRSAPGDSGAAVELLRTVVEFGNPALTTAITTTRVESAISSSGGSGAATRDDLNYTQTLIECRLGADCSAGSTNALRLCAQRGWCGADLQSALRDGLGDRFERLDRIASAVVADIKQGNYAALAVER